MLTRPEPSTSTPYPSRSINLLEIRIDQIAFDGMRKHLAADFDAIYVLHLGGNVRKNPKLSGSTHNVFGIQIGVAIAFFVKTGKLNDSGPRLLYAATDQSWTKEQKYGFLSEAKDLYPLEQMEKTNEKLNLRVERMRLSKDRTELFYNEFLTLKGIPAGAFDYRLGNRSALEWIIDQYQVFEDQRSGIINDPNRPDDPHYILTLIGQVIGVSLETSKVVRSLPDLGV